MVSMLRLMSLAPDITEAILRGDEPDGLSLEKLRACPERSRREPAGTVGGAEEKLRVLI